MLEGLAVGAGLQLLGVADGAGLVQVLVPAAMVEVIVRVDDVVDVVGLQAEAASWPGMVCSLSWSGFSNGSTRMTWSKS